MYVLFFPSRSPWWNMKIQFLGAQAISKHVCFASTIWMMRFSKYFDSECIPEWRKAYVDYQALKRQLANIKAVRMTRIRSSPWVPFSNWYKVVLSIYNSTTEPRSRRFSQRTRSMRTSVGISRQASLAAFDFELDRPTQTLNYLCMHGNKEEKRFVDMLDDDLKRVSRFYNGKYNFMLFPILISQSFY